MKKLLDNSNGKGKDFDPKLVDIVIELIRDRLNVSSKDIDDLILPSKLIIKTRENNLTIDGFYEKNKKNVIFRSIKPLEIIKKGDIISTILSIEKFGIIYEYTPKLRQLNNFEFVIEELKPKESQSFFGLLWDLNGNILIPSTKATYKISIKKVSGNDVMFYFDDEDMEQELELDKLFIIVVFFEEGTKIPLTGKVTNKIKFNNRDYFEFKFIGIKESYRDEIFRQIFRK